jgi:putative PEP-CTERM system histidine kinase
MGVGEIIYAGCGVAFLALIALMALRGRVSGIGYAIIGACALTAAWAGDMAFPAWLPQSVSPVLDALRLAAWLLLMVALVGLDRRRTGIRVSLPLVVAVAFCLFVIGCEIAMLGRSGSMAETVRRLHDFLRIALGVGGLLAAENLLRNADREQRRRLWPLTVAMGGTFAFELFLYADRLMVPGVNPMLADGRGLVGLLAVPLLAVAMARNREWRIDIHVSRTVVLHTAALVASGVFFLALAAVGLLVRQLGGIWGPSLQVLTLVGSAVVLVVVLTSCDAQVLLKRAISRHFFSNRFDYRVEWLRFVETVSQPGNARDALSVRVVRALAQMVDSPAGTLWFLDQGGYALNAAWNTAPERTQKIRTDNSFILAFRDGGWIQEQPPAGLDADWPSDLPRAWLAIPLSHANALIGFVVLERPRHPQALNWESFELLSAAGRQAASYLAEEQSTRALLDARLLHDYSKRFAFVVHDIKNLASQLGLVVSNARRHIDNPEFREDMLVTIESAVTGMNRLVAQLHSGAVTSAAMIEPDRVIAKLARDLSVTRKPIEARLGAAACAVAIDEEQFRSALSHLINNAREAAQSPGRVIVASQRLGQRITVDVVDDGPGMDDDFVRSELFRPLRSTKSGGMGIGAYQVREILRAAGGELEVISKKGIGTTMRMSLPMQDCTEMVRASA